MANNSEEGQGSQRAVVPMMMMMMMMMNLDLSFLDVSFSRIRRSISVVSKEILFYIDPRIYRFSYPPFFLWTPNKDD
jgi:hypothetical protein